MSSYVGAIVERISTGNKYRIVEIVGEPPNRIARLTAYNRVAHYDYETSMNDILFSGLYRVISFDPNHVKDR